MEDKELVRVIATGNKAVVQLVTYVNKVPYYIDVNRPNRVYTAYEIRKINNKFTR